MSVPAHVHEDAHPTSDHYEKTMDEAWWWLWPNLDEDELSKGLVEMPAEWNSGLPGVYYLMYTTNQRADFFGSEGEPGNTGYAWGDVYEPLGWFDFNVWPGQLGYYQDPDHVDTPLWVCLTDGELACIGGDSCYCPVCLAAGRYALNLERDDPAWVIAQRYTLVYAVRATASLFEIFLKEVDDDVPTTSLVVGADKYVTATDIYVTPRTAFSLSATDTAGVSSTEYRMNGGAYDSGWRNYGGPFTLGQLGSGLPDGEYTIEYRSTDRLGKKEVEKNTVVDLTTDPAYYRVTNVTTGLSYLGIQVAINAAVSDCVIEVKPSTYYESIDFGGKPIVLRSTGGPEVTTINGTGSLHVVTFVNGESTTSILDGFTITGGNAIGAGYPDGMGGGILCGMTQPTIRNCIITGNIAHEGGGIYFWMMRPVLANCLIYHNLAGNGGGALCNYSQPSISNCTFYSNSASTGPAGGIGSFASDTSNTPIISNCILWGDSPGEIAYSPFAPFVLYSNVQGLVWPLEGNISAPPQFANAAGGDYRLAGNSPCIDAGDNNYARLGVMRDLGDLPRFIDDTNTLDTGKGDSPVVDMGAYEFVGSYNAAKTAVAINKITSDPVWPQPYDFSLGYIFTVDSEIVVTHLGRFDINGGGLSSNSTARLYNMSAGGVPITTVTIPASSPAENTGIFNSHFAEIAPLTLIPGIQYALAVEVKAGDFYFDQIHPVASWSGGITRIAGISTPLFYPAMPDMANAVTFPLVSLFDTYYGPNFKYISSGGQNGMNVFYPQERSVYQRNAMNTAQVPVEGVILDKSKGIDSINARYLLTSGSSKVGPWDEIALDDEGVFEGQLEVPAGWYLIEVEGSSGGSAVFREEVEMVGVGEVFITAGQSNSANYGSPVQMPVYGMVSAWTGNGWRYASDPQPIADGAGGSPWPRLGDLLAASLNVPIGFISCGVGGTAVSQWAPGAEHYPRLEACLNGAGSNGVRALLWHQGETDAMMGTSSAIYADTLKNVINRIRIDAGGQVRWGIALAAYLPENGEPFEAAIRQGQIQVADTVEGAFIGPNTDQMGPSYRWDGAHFSENGLSEHGRGWHDAILRYLFMFDFDLSGKMDMEDFATFAGYWNSPCSPGDGCNGSDVNRDGEVDFADLVEFVERYSGE